MSGEATGVASRESLDLTAHEFELLRQLIYKHSGIRLSDSRRALVQWRLRARIRELNLDSFLAYHELITRRDPAGEELRRMLDAISTNCTQFFRDAQHFDHLQRQVFARWAKEPQIRVLSAGCSTGEEPYTIAICALETFGQRTQLRVRIDAGDISSRVLASARKGVYALDQLPASHVSRIRPHVLDGTGDNAGLVKIAPLVQSLVSFQRLNLKEGLHYGRPFHAIFCRNVAIYFDDQMQRRVLASLADSMVPGGTLFLSPCESLLASRERFRYLTPGIYERLPGDGPQG